MIVDRKKKKTVQERNKKKKEEKNRSEIHLLDNKLKNVKKKTECGNNYKTTLTEKVSNPYKLYENLLKLRVFIVAHIFICVWENLCVRNNKKKTAKRTREKSSCSFFLRREKEKSIDDRSV